MNKYKFSFVTCLLSLQLAYSRDLTDKINQQNKIWFTENLGQIHDQNGNARPDILFSGGSKNLYFHLSSTGLSYQWLYNKGKNNDSINSYRLDIRWPGANPNAMITLGAVQQGYSNYYLSGSPNGVLNVRSFESVLYKNIYPNIDVKWYGENDGLKYDYVIKPGGNYQSIKWAFSGAQILSVNGLGELVVRTPFGEVVQEAPTAIQGGKKIPCYFTLVDNVVSYKVENYRPDLELVIDPPVRLWGTYFGGLNADDGNFCTTDASGNVFMVGTTRSQGGTVIATSGSHQQYYGGGNSDAFIVKFDPSGARLWSTYVGGTGDDYGLSCSTDQSGNSYVCGYTTSGGNEIPTTGCLQPSYGGNNDAFLIKFDASGVKKWGTFYGGSQIDQGYSCATDGMGNVYMTGYTQSTEANVIATPGSFQMTPLFTDAFLVKFSPTGMRLWGTYFGNAGSDVGTCCTVDVNGNVYMCGATGSNKTTMSTAGAYQVTYGGGNEDGFIAQFSSSGSRIWSTYFGGTGIDHVNACTTDLYGNIFVSGLTQSTNNVLASSGAHQSSNGGSSDAFFAKFNVSGSLLWSTFYGGSGIDQSLGAAADAIGNVYFSGNSASGAGTIIASSNGFQTTMNGSEDAFLVKFNSAGVRQWGTYYGSIYAETGNGCAADCFGNVYLGCGTGGGTATDVATPGSFQPTTGGATDAFLVKFACTGALSVTAAPNFSVCSGNVFTLSCNVSTSSPTSFNWIGPASFTSSVQNPTLMANITPSLGTYTVVAFDASECFQVSAVTVTVRTTPSLTVTNTPTLICSGESASLTASGASSYTWGGGQTSPMIVMSPSQTETYTLTGMSSYGCKTSSVITQLVSDCTGLQNNTAKASAYIYPNPMSDRVSLVCESESEIIITDVVGRCVHKQHAGRGVTQINRGILSSGTYYLAVINENERFNFKLIVN